MAGESRRIYGNGKIRSAGRTDGKIRSARRTDGISAGNKVTDLSPASQYIYVMKMSSSQADRCFKESALTYYNARLGGLTSCVGGDPSKSVLSRAGEVSIYP